MLEILLKKVKFWVCLPGVPSSVTETDLSPDMGGSTGRRVRAGMVEAQALGEPRRLAQFG